MRLLAVWGYFAWRNQLDKLALVDAYSLAGRPG